MPSPSDTNLLSPDTAKHQLIQAGEVLPLGLRDAILSSPSVMIPMLVEVLRDEALAQSNGPGGGSAPIHAAQLLGKLKAPEAIEPLIAELQQDAFLSILHDVSRQALGEMGEAAVQPILTALGRTTDIEKRRPLCSALANLGVRDPRIWGVLLSLLEEGDDLEHAAMCLADYRDPAAIEPLLQAYDDVKIDLSGSILSNQTLIELRAAITDLGGTLSKDQEKKFSKAMAPRDAWRREINKSLSGPASSTTSTRRANLGRNERCWCGSGKKYKKCHLWQDLADDRANG